MFGSVADCLRSLLGIGFRREALLTLSLLVSTAISRGLYTVSEWSDVI